MAKRLNNPGTQHFDSNGDPLSGGKLYFYKTGTTTKKDTYSDNNLTTPNSNPVVLDSKGLEPNIFLDGTYRVILDDADDVQIWDRDNVNTASDQPFANWSSTISYDSGGDNIVTGSDGNYYVSNSSSNLGNDPAQGASEWDEFGLINVNESQSDHLEAIAGLTPDDSYLIVGGGATWTRETGATLRTTIGVGTGDTPRFTNVRLTGLTDTHVVIANPSGGLDSVDMSTTGHLLVGFDSSNPQALSVGSNEQVLEADSNEGLGVKWGVGVGKRLLASKSSFSGQGTVAIDPNDATIDNTYDEYSVELLNIIPDTDSVNLQMQTSTNSGNTYDSGASDYSYVLDSKDSTGTDDGLSSNGASAIDLSHTIGSATNEGGFSGTIKISRPSESIFTSIFWYGGYRAADGNLNVCQGFAEREAAEKVDAIQFLFSSGNFSDGIIKFYGIKK